MTLRMKVLFCMALVVVTACSFVTFGLATYVISSGAFGYPMKTFVSGPIGIIFGYALFWLVLKNFVLSEKRPSTTWFALAILLVSVCSFFTFGLVAYSVSGALFHYILKPWMSGWIGIFCGLVLFGWIYKTYHQFKKYDAKEASISSQ